MFDVFDDLPSQLSQVRHLDLAPDDPPESKTKVLIAFDGNPAWELEMPWFWALRPESTPAEAYAKATTEIAEHLNSLDLKRRHVDIYFLDTKGRVQIPDINLLRRLGFGPGTTGIDPGQRWTRLPSL